MPKIIAMSPFRCRVWDLHDRFESHVTEDTCKAEIESFSKHGQLIPALGRLIQGDPSYDVELVCGARRLFVARHLNKPLRVEIRELSDMEAIVAIDIENRQRTDISPYERGVIYTRWIRAGYFESQDDLVRALKISASRVSRLLKLARLPSIVVDAFGNALKICESWGLDLIEAIDDPLRRTATINKARAIAGVTPRPPPREVYRQLVSAPVRGCKPKPKFHDEVVTGDNGAPLFRIRHQRTSIALLLPVNEVSVHTLDKIRRAVVAILQGKVVEVENLPSEVSPGRSRELRSVDGLMQSDGTADSRESAELLTVE